MPKKALKNKKTKASAGKKKVKRAKTEKIIGKIEHIYDKINVVTLTLKNPLKIGDMIHIKGHTTDIVQAVDSIQIENASVQKAKKGDGIGIKVRGIVRDTDVIYFADKKTAQIKAPVFQQTKPALQTVIPTLPAVKKNQPPAEKPRFLSF